MSDLASLEPTLYLYARVSTDKQAKEGKAGIARQKEIDAVNRTVEKFKELPRKWMEDIGMSAYHGVNIEKGELGVFVDLCKQRQIASRSIIAIESIDRLTRLGLTDAQELVIQIMQAGVDIFIWNNDKLYTRDNVADTITIAIELEQAGKYSKNLSDKVIGSAEKRVQKALSGEKDEDGHTSAVRGYGTDAWWSDTSSGFVKPHPVYFKIAREIIDLNLQGLGHIKIRQYLEEKGYKSPRKASKKTGTGWGQNLITTFHRKRALLGEKVITIRDVKHVIPDYYPPLCTPEEFVKMNSIKKAKRAGGTKRNAALFSGFGKMRCGFCGNTIQTFLSKASTKYERQRYKCCGKDDPSVNCFSSTIDSRYLETALLKMLGVLIAQPAKSDNTFQILELESKVKDKEREIAGLADNIKQAGANILIKMLDESTVEKENMELEIAKLRQIPVVDPLKIAEIPPEIIDYTKTELRKEIREKVFSIVKSIEIKSYNKNTDFDVELYSGNVLNAKLIKNKHFVIGKSAIADHLSQDELGGTKSLVQSLRWSGIDRKGDPFNLEVVNSLGFDKADEAQAWASLYDVELAEVNKKD